MAEAMTYTSLISDIQSYLERAQPTDPDVYAQLPRFVMMAENRLAVELKTLGSIKYVNTNFTPSVATLTKPERWRDTVSIAINTTAGKQYLLLRNLEFVRSYWPDQTLTGVPQYYADYDYDHWLFCPTPAAGTQLEVAYYEKVQPLDSTNQTNWWTDYVPQILLYACMLEIMIYLKDDERIQAWQAMYDRALAAINGENKERSSDRTEKTE